MPNSLNKLIRQACCNFYNLPPQEPSPQNYTNIILHPTPWVPTRKVPRDLGLDAHLETGLDLGHIP